MVPIKITPCPIVDCIVELRFRTSVEGGAIFGIVYQAFKSDYPTVEKMSIRNIPEQIRIADRNLIYQPWYRLRNGGFHISIGSRLVGIGRTGEYPGWTVLAERFRRLIDTISGLGIVDVVERVGLRYINYFDFDIFTKSKLVVSVSGAPIASDETLVRAIIPGQRYKSTLHVSNHATVMVGGTLKTGSIIDIDTSLEADLKDFFQDSISIIDEGHAEEKEVFFSLLDDDLLRTLNPEY